ncbi:hypothetical protein K469DRAFT_686445 [Zopfia rhizophila CBS 207.26]|uniref:Cyclin N-terminal domain-containing protein n=1 Tax=Zopfia rhizophila CBS 207.26 TaxID=1314779 RepID=A0A6A6EWW8_9PEZI|nr:hypothetical protein K469DRAFT_686445 [Zopfia rhizophila CBS 207.26]
MDSPVSPNSRNRKDSIDSVELDTSFASTNTPPCNLPTPPLVPEARQFLQFRAAAAPIPSSSQSHFSDPSSSEYDEEQVIGLAAHASYLANAPSRYASRYKANPLIIHSFLLRSALPIETVALASCILASLSPSFAAAYRDACQASSGNRPSSQSPTASSSFADAFLTFQPTQGSSSNPDLLVLASLSLAFAFLDCRKAKPSYWSGFMSSGLYTEGQVCKASDCMLRDLGYRLYGFEEPVRAAVEDMTKSGSEVRLEAITW